jgi:hypothetical protein
MKKSALKLLAILRGTAIAFLTLPSFTAWTIHRLGAKLSLGKPDA